jgi:ADP-ribose diphosphatase
MPSRKLKVPSKAHPRRTVSRPTAPKSKVLSSKTVFQGRVFHVTRDNVTEPNGVTAIREVIRHSGSVVILAIDRTSPEPGVLLERQYRYAAGDYLLELPAGRIDPGENALTAGKRELLEETGYTARKWTKVLFFYPSPGFLQETMTVFLAENLKSGIAQPEADERIEHSFYPLSSLIRRIKTGTIRDGKTIAAVLWLNEHLRNAH